jgi:hypothetical protein
MKAIQFPWLRRHDAFVHVNYEKSRGRPGVFSNIENKK